MAHPRGVASAQVENFFAHWSTGVLFNGHKRNLLPPLQLDWNQYRLKHAKAKHLIRTRDDSRSLYGQCSHQSADSNPPGERMYH
ncbi:MAG TPA: hypothetical protein VK670_15385 [Silvibacterium sp.]|nr:hypothetical protein [Silvibacterium sp.]